MKCTNFFKLHKGVETEKRSLNFVKKTAFKAVLLSLPSYKVDQKSPAELYKIVVLYLQKN
jgi:hypothetical protein